MAQAKEQGGLKRSLSPPLLILVALGTTLGAGIYVVIGEIIGSAGYWTPVAFLAACVVALFFPTRTLASGTSAVILAVFTVANVALIRLKSKGTAEGFEVSAVVPWLGAASCIALLLTLPFAEGK